MAGKAMRHVMQYAPLLLLVHTLAAAQNTRSPVAAVRSENEELPLVYRPMDIPPHYNSNEPRLIPDITEQSRLRFQTPQWLQQIISFPPITELQKFYGKEKAGERNKASDAIRAVVNPGLLPDDFAGRLIPLAGWAILYEDWVNHGGTDVFLTKFKRQDYIIGLLETHNHVILLIRNEKQKRGTGTAEVVNVVFNYADLALSEHLKPVSIEGLKTFRSSTDPLFVYGYYQPRIDALTGKPNLQDLMTTGGIPNENYSSARANAVRWFSNGDFAAFMVLKPALGSQLKNPFEPRFERIGNAGGQERPFWESIAAPVPGADGAETTIRARQVEEYLGSFFYDEDGNKISRQIPMEEIERAFTELSPEQKIALVRRKVIDEYFVAGLKAYNSKDHATAIDYWTRVLKLEDDNPRASILLLLAIKARAAESYGGNIDNARQDRAVAAAQDLISRQQSLLIIRNEQEEQLAVKERAVVESRTRAIDLLSEGNYAESLREWNRILSMDPGNASALLFRDVCETKLKNTGRSRPR